MSMLSILALVAFIAVAVWWYNKDEPAAPAETEGEEVQEDNPPQL